MTSKFMGLNKGETKAMSEYFNYIEKEIDLHHKNQLIIKKKQSSSKRNDDLVIRFCPTQEVSEKRQQFLNSKAQFLLRMGNLKSIGQKDLSMFYLDIWIEENLDMFFSDPKMQTFISE